MSWKLELKEFTGRIASKQVAMTYGYSRELIVNVRLDTKEVTFTLIRLGSPDCMFHDLAEAIAAFNEEP